MSSIPLASWFTPLVCYWMLFSGNQSPSHMRGSLAPKVERCAMDSDRMLVRCSGATIHFSSLASALSGSPGQINYACSNAGLEMLSNSQKMLAWIPCRSSGAYGRLLVWQQILWFQKRFEAMGLAAIILNRGSWSCHLASI